jgi:hypothetical protein
VGAEALLSSSGANITDPDLVTPMVADSTDWLTNAMQGIGG